MRLLQVMAGAPIGGAEAFFERLTIALGHEGIEQTVVIRRDKDRGARLRKGGIEPIELRFGGKLDFTTHRALAKVARNTRPDVVLTWMNRATKMMPKGDYVSVARLGGYYNLKYYRGCDHLVGNTPDIVNYLTENGWPRDRAHHVPNFVTVNKAPQISRRVFSTPDDVPLVLSMGRLHECKGFDVLLQAMAYVPDAYLWIAGDGPERGALVAQTKKLGITDRVKFVGWQQDVAPLLAACDVYVCASRLEPLGNAFIEAWAASKPVVATAAEGPLALIKNGESGLLVPIDSTEELARSICKMIDDTDIAERCAGQGYDTFRREFAKEAVVAKYLDFFSHVTKAY